MKANKEKSLIDFVASIPAMVTKAATRDNIQHGLVDDKFKRYPDFNKMLSTRRRNPGNYDYNRCIETFPYLFDRCLEDGHVPDLEFESLGFKQDINIQGNYVRREFTITQESRQRAKCLTHEYQAEQRMERKIQFE